MRLFDMKNRGLEHPVYNGSTCVLPVGTTHVKIGFCQSHLVRNERSGKVYGKDFNVPLTRYEKRLNVYIHHGNVIHA